MLPYFPTTVMTLRSVTGLNLPWRTESDGKADDMGNLQYGWLLSLHRTPDETLRYLSQ